MKSTSIFWLLAYYRTFLLTDEIRRRLPSVTDKTLEAGETLYWESESLGGSSKRFPYPPSTASREKLLAALMERGKNHARGRDITLSPCLFVVQAKAREREAAQNALRLSEAAEDRDTGSNRMQPHIRAEFLPLEDEKIRLTEQLDRAKQYRLRLENEKDELMRRVAEADEKLRHKTIQDREEVAYLRRCMDRPSRAREDCRLGAAAVCRPCGSCAQSGRDARGEERTGDQSAAYLRRTGFSRDGLLVEPV